MGRPTWEWDRYKCILGWGPHVKMRGPKDPRPPGPWAPKGSWAPWYRQPPFAYPPLTNITSLATDRLTNLYVASICFHRFSSSGFCIGLFSSELGMDYVHQICSIVFIGSDVLFHRFHFPNGVRAVWPPTVLFDQVKKSRLRKTDSEKHRTKKLL